MDGLGEGFPETFGRLFMFMELLVGELTLVKVRLGLGDEVMIVGLFIVLLVVLLIMFG
jgi:hypothetical protein